MLDTFGSAKKFTGQWYVLQLEEQHVIAVLPKTVAAFAMVAMYVGHWNKEQSCTQHTKVESPRIVSGAGSSLYPFGQV